MKGFYFTRQGRPPSSNCTKNFYFLLSSLVLTNKFLGFIINTEIEINANKINIELLENVDFTPSEMAVLEPFVEMDE